MWAYDQQKFSTLIREKLNYFLNNKQKNRKTTTCCLTFVKNERKIKSYFKIKEQPREDDKIAIA